MNVIERWAAEELARVPTGPPVSELRHRVHVRRMRRAGTLAVLAAALTFVVVASLLRSPSEPTVRVIAPPTTSSTSTTSTRPDAVRLTTRWRPLDKPSAGWAAALAAIRTSDAPAAAVERVLPILRADRAAPTERVTARVVAVEGEDAVIWIEWRGLPDDSVAGRDVKVHVTTGATGLVVLSAESRSVCARAAGSDLDACL